MEDLNKNNPQRLILKMLGFLFSEPSQSVYRSAARSGRYKRSRLSYKLSYIAHKSRRRGIWMPSNPLCDFLLPSVLMAWALQYQCSWRRLGMPILVREPGWCTRYCYRPASYCRVSGLGFHGTKALHIPAWGPDKV